MDPVYRLRERKYLGTDTCPQMATALVGGELAFRPHQYGHTPEPHWPTFLSFARWYLTGLPS